MHTASSWTNLSSLKKSAIRPLVPTAKKSEKFHRVSASTNSYVANLKSCTWNSFHTSRPQDACRSPNHEIWCLALVQLLSATISPSAFLLAWALVVTGMMKMEMRNSKSLLVYIEFSSVGTSSKLGVSSCSTTSSGSRLHFFNAFSNTCFAIPWDIYVRHLPLVCFVLLPRYYWFSKRFVVVFLNFCKQFTVSENTLSFQMPCLLSLYDHIRIPLLNWSHTEIIISIRLCSSRASLTSSLIVSSPSRFCTVYVGICCALSSSITNFIGSDNRTVGVWSTTTVWLV